MDFSVQVSNFILQSTDKKVYRKCLQKNRVVHFVETINLDNIEPSYYDIYLFPYLKTSKILLCAKSITSQQYKILKNNLSTVNTLYPESDRFGACEISITDKKNPYIVGCNKYFKNLHNETNIKILTLVNTIAFQKCMVSLSSETADIVLKDHVGETKHFKINVTHIPEIQKNHFMIVLIPEERANVDIDLDLTSLTPRQKEIILHVANGFTNRYIANKLSVTEGTVKKTIYNSYKKLGICSRMELVKRIN